MSAEEIVVEDSKQEVVVTGMSTWEKLVVTGMGFEYLGKWPVTGLPQSCCYHII